MEEAAQVVVLGFVLGSGPEFGLEFDLVLGRGCGLEPEWESDQESLQELAQDQDMELGRCQVCRGPLGCDQVPTHHRSHQVSGCTVSGTLLKWANVKNNRRLSLS